MKPSDIKINPYTGKKIERVSVKYPSPQVGIPGIK
jgi:hypothetical protein